MWLALIAFLIAANQKQRQFGTDGLSQQTANQTEPSQDECNGLTERGVAKTNVAVSKHVS